MGGHNASVTLLQSVIISTAHIFFFPESDYFLVNTVKIINFMRKKSSFSFNMYLQSSSVQALLSARHIAQTIE